MGSACDKLCAFLGEPDPFDHTYAELEPLWIDAFNERLAERREQIPVLAKLVESTGVERISSLDEIVPLLFAHSNYKSYPTTLVTKGKWSGMNAWLDTVSTQRAKGLDVDGVHDQDDWIERLHAAGHMVMATSGTSGKNSFLPGTRGDIDFSMRAIVPVALVELRHRAAAGPTGLRPRPEVRADACTIVQPHDGRGVWAPGCALLPHRGAAADQRHHPHGGAAEGPRRRHRDAQ